MADKLAGGVKAGGVDVSLPVLLRKTTDNTETTGVASGSVTASYWRQGGVRTAITVSALGSVNAAHSDGGWIEVDATNQPGLYRFDVPDAAFATGADWVIVTIKVTGSYVFHERFNLETKGAAENNAELTHASYGLSKLVRSATPANTLDINASGGVEVGSFQNDVITASAIASGAITSAKFASGAIDASAIAADAIGASELAADAASEIAAAVRQASLTEGYAADGAAATLEQMLYMIWSALSEFSISGTTITCKKLDGTTTSMTFTLNDAVNPSSRTRAS